MSRQSWDSYLMSLAHAAATMGTCSRRKVGAIAVRDRRVLATGFNGSPAGTHHCEHEKYGNRPESYVCPVDYYHLVVQDPVTKKFGCFHCQRSAVLVEEQNECVLSTERRPIDPDLIIVNGRPSCSNAVHAEANVLAYAAADGVALRGATIYTNTYPCHGCAKQMVSCGIVEVVYDADYCNDPLVARLCDEAKMVLRRYVP